MENSCATLCLLTGKMMNNNSQKPRSKTNYQITYVNSVNKYCMGENIMNGGAAKEKALQSQQWHLGYIYHSRYRNSPVGIIIAVQSLLKFLSHQMVLGLGPSSKLKLYALLGPKIWYPGFFENMKKENE